MPREEFYRVVVDVEQKQMDSEKRCERRAALVHCAQLEREVCERLAVQSLSPYRDAFLVHLQHSQRDFTPLALRIRSGSRR